MTLEFSVHWRCWSDLGQTSKQNVSKSFGVAHAIEASDFDQLAPEDGLQAFLTVTSTGELLSLTADQLASKALSKNLTVERVELTSK